MKLSPFLLQSGVCSLILQDTYYFVTLGSPFSLIREMFPLTPSCIRSLFSDFHFFLILALWLNFNGCISYSRSLKINWKQVNFLRSWMPVNKMRMVANAFKNFLNVSYCSLHFILIYLFSPQNNTEIGLIIISWGKEKFKKFKFKP